MVTHFMIYQHTSRDGLQAILNSLICDLANAGTMTSTHYCLFKKDQKKKIDAEKVRERSKKFQKAANAEKGSFWCLYINCICAYWYSHIGKSRKKQSLAEIFIFFIFIRKFIEQIIFLNFYYPMM